MTSRRARAISRLRRIRRERHSWRFVTGGLIGAILVGSSLATFSGQAAAAQAADAATNEQMTVVKADWKVDTVVAGMVADEKAAADAAAAKAAAEKAAADAAAKKEAEQAALPWMSPSKADITSYFGMRDGRLHGGTDFANWTGDKIVAASDGVVSYVGYEEGGYGNVVYIDHGDGVQTRYAHASKVLVSEGDKVSKGDAITLAGATGHVTGPHLHFEVLIDGEKVDSLKWLQDQGVDVG